MLVLNNSYEFAATYLQDFLPWIFRSELVLSDILFRTCPAMGKLQYTQVW